MSAQQPARYIITIAMALSALAGCCHRPSGYVSPTVQLCQGWRHGEGQPEHCHNTRLDWWEAFHDPTLTALQECAMAAAPDVKAALARFEQAYARWQQSLSPLLPAVSINPTFHNEGRVPPSFLEFPGEVPLPPRIVDRLYRFPFVGSYEPDIWGKHCSRGRAAAADADAAHYRWIEALLLLGGQVADLYYAVSGLQKQIQAFTALALVRQQLVDLYRESFNKGLVPLTPLLEAEMTLQATLQQQADLQRQKAMATDLLATLLGTTACCFDIEASPLTEPPPMPPIALPRQVVALRPDVAAAERFLASCCELTDAAVADRLPSLRLTGELGYANPLLDDLFHWQSRLWSYTYDLAQTLFDAGYKAAVVQEAAARYREAAALYEGTVLAALRDVEDALAATHSFARQVSIVQSSLAMAQHNSSLASLRRRRGLASAVEELQSREQLLLRTVDLAIAQGEWYRAVSRLMVAMGGLWEGAAQRGDDTDCCTMADAATQAADGL